MTTKSTVDGNSRRILFVCLGNYCRSPLAAAVLAHLGGAAVEVRSAGLRDKWVDKPAHPAMVTAAAAAGYDLSGHRGVQVEARLLEWADRIVAMDAAALEALQELTDEDTAGKIVLYLGDQDVPDPFGHPDEAFSLCVDLVAAGAHRHL